MPKPVFIEPTFNKDAGDCCITCLVMWTGKGYLDVVAAAPLKAVKNGMGTREVVETAAKLGHTFIAKRKFDLFKDDGVLLLAPTPSKHPGSRWLRPHHAVVLLNGVVLDPFNGRVWPDVEVYLAVEKYKASSLLVEEVDG